MQKRLTWVTLFSVAIVVTALYHTRKVHATPNNDGHDVCSVASLKGTYAFLNTGVTHTGLDTPVDHAVNDPVAELGIAFFNGDGKRGPIRSTASFNGTISDWTNSGPHGSYTIDPDCTGSFFAVDGTKTYNIVILDGGKRFLLLDLQPGTTISAELTRIEEDKD
jgi:hypothetical protein